jgi:hypothetical protein
MFMRHCAWYASLFLSLLTTLAAGCNSHPLKENGAIRNEGFSPTPWTDLVESLLRSKAPSSLDETLATLPEELRKKYLLVYASRSRQSASLAYPRVILLSPEEQFYLSFSDRDGIGSGDQEIEMIEAYGLEAPRFSRISFSQGVAHLERDPQICAACHGGVPIFDSYPHWPGFFGSSHDGKAYGEKYGSGQVPRLESEAQALKAFVAMAPSRERFRHLKNLEMASLSTLSNLNMSAGAKMIHQLHERQARQIFESLSSIEELNEAFTMSFPILDWADDGPIYHSEFSNGRQYSTYRGKLATDLEAASAESVMLNGTRRLQRFRESAQTYGTEWDKLWVGTRLEPYNAIEVYRPGYSPLPAIPAEIGVPIRNVMNYFDDEDYVRYPGFFYRYWREQHPRAEPIAFNNLHKILEGGRVRQATALTFSFLLSSYFLGEEHAPAIPGLHLGRNYRDFEELYARVPLPLKQYAFEDFARYPRLQSAVDEIQKRFIAIIRDSPLRGEQSARIFRDLKSWSSQNRKSLEEILADGWFDL